MKIGVAFSGSGPAACAAGVFADELERCSLRLFMLSATSLAAVSGLLWARGITTEESCELLRLLESDRPACALRQIERLGAFAGTERCPVAVNSVDTTTGITLIHTDCLTSDAWNLQTRPLRGCEAKALAAAVSPWRNTPPLALDGMRLCDFSARYGCPFFPLRMCGAEKLLSVSFAGGETPAQIASDSLAALTGGNADLHYTVRLTGEGSRAEQVRAFVQTHIEQIYHTLLF